MDRRVVVTGMGVISPIGINLEDFWNSLITKKSGIDKIKSFDASKFQTYIGGEVKDLKAENYINNKKNLKLMVRSMKFGVCASRLAYEHSGLTQEYITPERLGVYVGTGMISPDSEDLKRAFEVSIDEEGIFSLNRFGMEGIKYINPLFLLKGLSNNVLGFVSIEHNAQGSNCNIFNSAVGGAMAVGEAFRAIKHGKADAIITGGYDSLINLQSLFGYGSVGLLTPNCEPPEMASRPFDKYRSGMVPAEGSAFLVLEELSFAIKRGAKVFGEIIGYGASMGLDYLEKHNENEAPRAKAHGFRHPPRYIGEEGNPDYASICPDYVGEVLSRRDKMGIYSAIEFALKEASIQPSQIEYVCANGSSTKWEDALEAKVIKDIFGRNGNGLKVSSIKSLTGHLMAASGPLEIISTLLAIDKNILPPIANLYEVDDECRLDFVLDDAEKMDIEYAINNCFYLGGQSVSIIMKRYN